MGLASGHHLHDELLQQERWVVMGACVLFFGYFGMEIYFEAAQIGLFSHFSSGNFFVQLGGIILDVWKNNIMPIFVVVDILLILIGMYALVRVWPMKQSMKIFRLKPHGHGEHGDSHGGHDPAHGGGVHASAHPTHTVHQTGNPATLKHWSGIVHRANTGTPENLRWAVMEADALVDHVLRQRGLQGETFADRLQNARWAGSKLVDKVFDAHRLRNELAHTPGYQMTTRQAERALFAFRDFLKELKEF